MKEASSNPAGAVEMNDINHVFLDDILRTIKHKLIYKSCLWVISHLAHQLQDPCQVSQTKCNKQGYMDLVADAPHLPGKKISRIARISTMYLNEEKMTKAIESAKRDRM